MGIMTVLKLKSCTKCNAELLIQREADGWYEVCLVCGYHKDVSNLVTLNTVGQVKITCPIEDGQKSSTAIEVTHTNSKVEP
jgi:DNA-directed RNA polymerase subunit M/transcription elongation factor TFIIS